MHRQRSQTPVQLYQGRIRKFLGQDRLNLRVSYGRLQSIDQTQHHLAAKATALLIYMTLSRAGMVLFLTLFMCLLSGAIATRKLQSADPADMF